MRTVLWATIVFLAGCGGEQPESCSSPGTFYADADGDGHGDPGVTKQTCAAEAGYVALPDDCDDADASVHPGAPESCDGVDQDCDGTADDDPATGGTLYYADFDGDGFGNPGLPVLSCAAVPGWVADATDCDDASAAAHPGATEICDGFDDDCDGQVDDADADVDASTGHDGWADADRDGYGDPSEPVRGCSVTTVAGDCNDANSDIHPGRAEICDDGLDQDCDGTSNGCGADGSARDAVNVYGTTTADDDAQFGLDFVVADVDGDKVLDVVGAMPYAGGSDGGLRVVPGTALVGDVDSATAASATVTSTSYGFLGMGVAAADFDGDGRVEVVAGAPTSSFGDSGSAGVVYSFEAPSGALTTADHDGFIAGMSPGNWFGTHLADGGDPDGDKDDDLLVSAPYASSCGVVYLFDDGAEKTVEGAMATYVGPASSAFGWRFSGGRDVDGDGAPELLATTSSGRVYLMPEEKSGTWYADDAAEAVVDVGRQTQSVALVPDLDGDGTDDVVIGNEYASWDQLGDGAAYVFRKPSGALTPADADVTLTGAGAGSYGNFGSSLAAGDVDGDGAADLVVGAGWADQWGKAYVFLGGPGLAGTIGLGDAALTMTGANVDSMLGSWPIVVADRDGDGRSEVFVGSPDVAYGGVETSTITMFPGGSY